MNWGLSKTKGHNFCTSSLASLSRKIIGLKGIKTEAVNVLNDENDVLEVRREWEIWDNWRMWWGCEWMTENVIQVCTTLGPTRQEMAKSIESQSTSILYLLIWESRECTSSAWERQICRKIENGLFLIRIGQGQILFWIPRNPVQSLSDEPESGVSGLPDCVPWRANPVEQVPLGRKLAISRGMSPR